MLFKKYLDFICLVAVCISYGSIFYAYNWSISLLHSGIREVVASTFTKKQIETKIEPVVIVPDFLDIRSLTSQRYLFTLTKEVEKQLSEIYNTGILIESEYETFPRIYQSGSEFIFDIWGENIGFPVSSYFFDIWNKKKTNIVSWENLVSWEIHGKNSKKIALTFDDGPNSKYTSILLDILKNEKVPVTFYVLGNKVEQFPDIVKREYAEWHEIGSHSYEHAFLQNKTTREVQEDLYKTDQAVYRAIWKYPTTFRPPYGAINTGMLDKIAMPIVLWSVDPHDWKTLNKYKNIQSIKHTKNGDIIIMHDIHQASIESITDMILFLKKESFTFVTVSELLDLTESDTKVGKICFKSWNCK